MEPKTKDNRITVMPHLDVHIPPPPRPVAAPKVRLVSLLAFWRIKCISIGRRGLAYVLLLLSALLTVISSSFVSGLFPVPNLLDARWWIAALAGVCGLALGMYATIKGAILCLYPAKQTEIIVPLTRHTAAYLPATDSLVRASAEPLQEQKTVLLRAAATGMEAPPEEMLRASMGQE